MLQWSPQRSDPDCSHMTTRRHKTASMCCGLVLKNVFHGSCPCCVTCLKLGTKLFQQQALISTWKDWGGRKVDSAWSGNSKYKFWILEKRLCIFLTANRSIKKRMEVSGSYAMAGLLRRVLKRTNMLPGPAKNLKSSNAASFTSLWQKNDRQNAQYRKSLNSCVLEFGMIRMVIVITMVINR